MPRLPRWLGWTLFAVALASVSVAIFALASPQPRMRIDGVIGVAISNDGGTLVATSMDAEKLNSVGIWDTRTGRLLKSLSLELKNGFFDEHRLSPDRAWLIDAERGNGSLQIVNLSSGAERVVDLSEQAIRTKVRWLGLENAKVNFFSQSRYVFLHFDREVLAVVELASGEVRHFAKTEVILGFISAPPTCLYLDKDSTVCSFNLETKTKRQLPEGNRYAAISEDSSLIFTLQAKTKDFEEGMHFWDSTTLALKHRLPEMNTMIRYCISPDRRTFATTNRITDGVEIWDLESGERRWMLPCKLNKNRPQFISPDGRTLVGSDEADEKVAVFFDLETGRKTGHLSDFDTNADAELRFLDDRLVAYFDSNHAEKKLFLHPKREVRVARHAPGKASETFAVKQAEVPLGQMPPIITLSPDSRRVLHCVYEYRKQSEMIDKVRLWLKRWIPFDPPSGDCSRVTVHDLVGDEIVFDTVLNGQGFGVISGDNRTLVMTLYNASTGRHSTCVWDLPQRRPWHWIVGVPAALGASLLGVRWGWRRWRAVGSAAGNVQT